MIATEKYDSPVYLSTTGLSHRQQRRFILIGGFLGSGKTTVIGQLAKWLSRQGRPPGIITNDQGEGLIDTALGRSHAAHVREVTGGCFCCRAEELGKALRELEGTVGNEIAKNGAGGTSALPAGVEVFIAEPVGSCTDLVATVILPMARIHGEPMAIAPMSVLIDAVRLEAVMKDEQEGSPGGRRSGFTADVRYIFDKQLEEAELLVLNKCDLLTAKRLSVLKAWLQARHPGRRVLTISAVTQQGLEEWFALLMAEQSQPKSLISVDYERYGAGEARMGWYNASLGLHSTGQPLDGNRVLLRLAREIQKELEAEGAELAHFKMSLGRRTHPAVDAGQSRPEDFAVINAVRNGGAVRLSRRSEERFIAAGLLVNLRAEAEPGLLDKVLSKHLGRPRKEWRAVWKNREAFKPGQPKPTHRAVSV